MKKRKTSRKNFAKVKSSPCLAIAKNSYYICPVSCIKIEKKPEKLFYMCHLMHSLNIGHNLTIATVSMYEYVTLPPFYHPILNFSVLKSKLFEVSKTKELPEATSSVTSVNVGNHRIQLNIHSRKKPIHKPSLICKSHSDDGWYPWSNRMVEEAQAHLTWLSFHASRLSHK